VLTLDSNIQYYLQKHLEQAVLDYDCQSGAAAIAMDVKTGAILGLVSLGDFDLNQYQTVSLADQEKISASESDEEKSSLLFSAQQLQWRDKVLMDTYEPGSTFKIITLSMALEEGLANEEEEFYCGGTVPVLGRNDPVNCWKSGGHGSQTLVQAVQHSCNVAFVNLGLRVGEEKFYQYAEAFGFFNTTGDKDAQLTGKTGVDLGGEGGSIWWPESTFINRDNLSQLAAASFGQTFNITPIQLITAISACCNGGYLMKPYIVDEIRSPDGTVIEKHEPAIVRQVISEETSSRVNAILEQVVGDSKDGTGKNAYVAGYRIGGKTGTSVNTTLEASTGKKQYIVSFVGIAPMDDPQIAILVLLDSPSNETGIYISGGQMAAPTVGKIMADVLPYLGVKASYSEVELALTDKVVPNVKSLSIAEAKAALSEQGFSSRVVGDGDTVTAQLPLSTSVVASGSEIILYAAAEPSDSLAVVPKLTGLSYAAARQQLGALGLFVKSFGNRAVETGYVYITQQSYPSGAQVAQGTVIEVTLIDTSDKGLY
jgi:stage V sporulation protein D (sporulation-specific penicillin-binding protein)